MSENRRNEIMDAVLECLTELDAQPEDVLIVGAELIRCALAHENMSGVMIGMGSETMKVVVTHDPDEVAKNILNKTILNSSYKH